jgi:hypothetical protein
MSDIHKRVLIELCAKNIVSHAMGNNKYSSDLYKQYELVMQEGTPELVELINKVLHNRGIKI